MKIIGTGSAVPLQIVSNNDLAAILDTSDEWITTRTGISRRHILGSEKLEDLAAAAAEKAIADAGLSVSDIDFILCSNVYNDYMTPSLACVVHGMIGAKCPCLDLDAACAGFIYALYTAEAYLKMGRKNILIVAAETPVKMCDWQDRTTCVLFGDAAGAVVVTAGDFDSKYIMNTDTSVETLYAINPPSNCPYTSAQPEAEPVTMNGQKLYKYVVSEVSEQIMQLLAESGISADDVDHFIMHQANLRIIEAVRMRIDQAKEKFPTNIEEYGNTSSASVPLLLDELAKQNQIADGEIIVMSAFGAGIVTGTIMMHWNKSGYNG